MQITDHARGDLVVIVWPTTSDTGWRGPFSDYSLAGREVLVQYGGPASTSKLSRKSAEHGAAFVTVCDWETLRPSADPRAFRCIANVEVLDVVESKHRKVDEATERAIGREGDAVDPFSR